MTRSRTSARLYGLVVCLSLCVVATTVAGSVCPFDCDADGKVEEQELQQAVSALFDRADERSCPKASGQSFVRVAELLRAVATAALADPLCSTGVMSHWRQLPPLPAGPRQEVGTAVVGGEMYVVGGITPGAVGVPTVEAFDPDSGQWRRVADLPQPLHHVAVASDDSALYAVGGFAAPAFRPVAYVYRYRPEVDEWEALPPLPEPLGAAAAAVSAGRLHVLGGSGNRGSVTSHSIFDFREERWVRAAPLPVAVNHLAAVVYEGAVFVVGGRRDGSGFQNHAGFYRYIAEEDRWQEEPPLPTARSGHAAAVVGEWLAVFGGEVDPSRPPTFVFPQVEVYHFPSRRWLSDLPMPLPRHGFAAATIGNVVYLPGGAYRAGLGETAWVDLWEMVLPAFAD